MDDTKNEDTMVRQIEKNLSNNINENLFLTGRVVEYYKKPLKNDDLNTKIIKTNELNRDLEDNSSNQDYPLVSNDYISNNPQSLSRAEYIRQAREACLRQMSNSQVYCNPYDSSYAQSETSNPEPLTNKKSKALRLFQEGSQESAYTNEGNTPQEIAAFRALIIRTVCAIVLFLFVFVIDKFDIEVGKITPNLIREYVTGNDTFQELENILVTWLK